MKEIFGSDRYFVFFDFLISHCQLLLRSQKHGENISNIDIIFIGTTYIQSFIRLQGLRIRTVERGESIINYDGLKKYLGQKDSYLFEIESKGEKYYIAATFVIIYENQLEFSETSLGFSRKRKEKEIARSR